MSVFVKTVKLHDNWELQLSVRSGDVIMSILQFVTKLNLSNLQLRNIRIEDYHQTFSTPSLGIRQIRVEMIEMKRGYGFVVRL